MTTTAPAPARPQNRVPRVQVSPVTQRRVISSEWAKFTTLRSTWVTLAVALLGMIAVGALASWAIDAHWSHMHPDDRASFSPITQSLTGVYLAQLAIGVLGVLVISGEYATGMIRATLSAAPRRLLVLWAKLTVFSVVTFVLMLVGALVSFFLGQALLHSHGTTLGAHEALQAVVGVALYLTVVGALGVAIGFCVRSTAGGIATLFGVLLVLPTIGHVLPASWQTHILPYLPSNAGGALYSLHPDPGTLAPWAGFGVMCCWMVAAVVAAVVLLRRRDA
ncbi:MAG TPA: ABC transporter permease [Mycobacteriales bacterium]|jgi:ABC-type transport system involved in multi-copper enzyme maturation permease subunit|nr:ABC transporter permease [Mycobacteriales bacterium]